ncbi:MAG: BrnT family toxin [Pseudomonadota bacterium]
MGPGEGGTKRQTARSSFERAKNLAWTQGLYARQVVRGEPRVCAVVPLDERLYVCVFVDRDKHRRIISLRKANAREVRRYQEVMG